MKNQPYNPLDKHNLGKSIAESMLASDVQPLPPSNFEGAGIYAIYYVGDFTPYKALKEKNLKENYSAPIYVGKAVPAGARRGGLGLDAKPGKVLFNRLADHAASIEQAKNLKLRDFKCRYLTVDDIWIPLGESLLIEMFHPLWNHKIDGFGNHDPGAGRHKGKRSAWDVIHPGRSWADRLQPNPKSQEAWLKEVKEFIAKGRRPETTIKIPKGV
ncbi:MAG: Eco29kI family restriction endonuclease [Bdellovibrionales bacterium]